MSEEQARSAEELALALAAVAEVKKRLGEHEARLRQEISEHMVPGDRKVATLPDGTPVGRVTRTSGRAATASVRDHDAYLAWVRWEAPTEVVHVPEQVIPERWEVRPSFTAAVLKKVAEDAMKTGELPEWASLSEPGEPGLQVGKPTAAQAEAIAQAWTAGVLAPVLAIGGTR